MAADNSNFERYVQAILVSRVAWASGLATVLISAGALFRRGVGADDPFILRTRMILVLAFATIYALTRLRRATPYAFVLAAGMTLVGTAGAFTLGLSGQYSNEMYWGLHVIVFGSGLLFPYKSWQMALACVGLFAPFAAIYVLNIPWPEPLSMRLYFLCGSAVVSVVGCHLSYSLRKREFEARRALEQSGAELTRTSEQLREVNRLKSRLITNISHELRTPLTLILAPIEALRSAPEVAASPTAQRNLARLQRNATLLLRLVNGLLDLAQLEVGQGGVKLQPVPLQSLLRALLDELEPLIQLKRLRLVLDCVPELSVLADLDKLETVLRNLLSNAIKFSHEGGSIWVRAQREDGRVEVSVKDEGPGIDPNDHERIFDRFVQVSPAGGGTGIGLALVKELVELQGGRVKVESAHGEGATFRICLPGQESAAAAPLTAPRRLTPVELPAPPEAVRVSDRVLVIEDNPELRAFIVEYLSRHFRVFEARSAEEGAEVARRELPHVVVSDVLLPGRSGFDVPALLREDPRTTAIPVILLTALHSLDSRLEGLGHGAVDFVGKPFSADELLARIKVQIRLRELFTRLADTQKMSLLHTLTSGIAHEIRNPLNAIMNATSLLRRHGDGLGPPGVLEILDESSRTIAVLIDQLVTFQQPAKRGEWSPVAAVESSLRLLGERAAAVKVHRDFAFDGLVVGQPEQLNQIVMNLLDNALRAVIGQGTIGVRTGVEGGAFCLTVWDDGAGISLEHQDKVFEPFFTTRDPNEGMGLGLHVSRSIARAHGGDLTFSSTPGQGAAFRLQLPLAAVLDKVA